ncbi:hypothetical protein Tco_0555554 [Tanacetum coccineum]
MTRSLTMEVFTPFENPKREFRTSKKVFKTPGLDESSSPEFDLFSDLEENYEEEVIETMVETMEQYMSKTQADYGSGVTRTKIDDKYHFKLKGQFLKELRDNTFSGSDHEDANEYIEKVSEIVDLLHIPNITQDQIMLRAFPMSLTRAASRWLRNKPSVLTRQILDSKGAIPTKTAVDAKVAIQKMAKYSQKWHNGTSRTRSTKTSDGLAAIQAQLNNLGREIKKVNKKVYAAQEIRASTNAAIRNQGASIKALEIQMSKVLKEKGSISLPSSTEMNPRDHVNSISNTVEADTTLIRHIRSTRYAVSRKGSYGLKDLDGYSIGTTLRDDSPPKKEKDPGSFTLPCYINNVCFEKSLDDLGASVSVMPLSTYLNLGKVVNKPIIDIVKARSDFIVGLDNHPSEYDFDRRIHIDFVEDMDPYHDEGIGDVIVEEPFRKSSCVEAKRFDGIITIRDGDDSVTYQMVRKIQGSNTSLMKNATRSYRYRRFLNTAYPGPR